MTTPEFFRVLLLLLLALACPLQAIADVDPDLPAVSGYVTRCDASGAFEVNGYKILVSRDTTFSRAPNPNAPSGTQPNPLPAYLGERMDVFGKMGKRHSVVAQRIFLPARAFEVSGIAIIDRLPQGKEVDADGARVVRADGYLLRLTHETKLISNPPLTPADDLNTNVWIEYHGLQQKSGQVLVDRAVLTANKINASEDKLREKVEYDPAQIDDGDKQGFMSKHVLGLDPKRIPAYIDKPMQERIDRIGSSLIPAYQRSLPANDETKIEFRFQLIDDPGSFSGVALPSGVILIQKKAVERLTDDTQLAAILADFIAEALEKNTFRMIPANQNLLAANIVGTGAGLLIPGLGLATGLTTGRSRHICSD